MGGGGGTDRLSIDNQAVSLGSQSGASARHVPSTVFHPTPYTNLCLCILPILPGAGEMPCPPGAAESQPSEILRVGCVSEAGSIWVSGEILTGASSVKAPMMAWALFFFVGPRRP